MNTAEKIRKELEQLISDGAILGDSLVNERREEGSKKSGKPTLKIDFLSGYQSWYTKASAVVRDLLPHRLIDFRALYQIDKRRDINVDTYGIADYLVGISLAHHSSDTIVMSKYFQQLQIVRSCKDKLDSSLLNIRQLVHADFLDSEIEEARELLTRGFLRPAGAIAGVALEKHLALICSTHEIPVKKKDPSIGDLNETLKNADVYDTPTWRLIGVLADIRNLCDHNKKRDPTSNEVLGLINGVEKIVKSVH